MDQKIPLAVSLQDILVNNVWLHNIQVDCCVKYWSENGESVAFGDVTASTINEMEAVGFKQRELKISGPNVKVCKIYLCFTVYSQQLTGLTRVLI